MSVDTSVQHDTGNPFAEDQAYTIADFCRAVRICRKTYERKRDAGQMPYETRLPALGIRITGRHARAWWDGQVR